MAVTKLRVKMLEVVGPRGQNRFADSLGINQGRMSQYCTGCRKIPPKHLLLISKALHCSVMELVGYQEMERVGHDNQ